MRFVVVLALLAACDFGQHETVGDGAAGDGGAAPVECASDTDCVLASSSCCGCPEFAMPEAGWGSGCNDVMCPMPPTDCPAIAAACVAGYCTTTCAQVMCDLSCPGGFAADAAGCLTCACADAPTGPGACLSDSDCVEIPADCCGCAQGGSDEAVLAADAQAIIDARMCPPDAACPGVDVCDPAATVTCVGGGCVLTGTAPENMAAGCGRPDLPACPDGTVCVLNADPTSQMDGVGSCQPG